MPTTTDKQPITVCTSLNRSLYTTHWRGCIVANDSTSPCHLLPCPARSTRRSPSNHRITSIQPRRPHLHQSPRAPPLQLVARRSLLHHQAHRSKVGLLNSTEIRARAPNSNLLSRLSPPSTQTGYPRPLKRRTPPTSMPCFRTPPCRPHSSTHLRPNTLPFPPPIKLCDP